MAGIYIHIPFCKKACHYCNFHFSTSAKYINEMVSSISMEVCLRKDYINENINTIYFGGGTPSLLNEEQLQQIFKALRSLFNISIDAEITLEANPDDINQDVLQQWKAAGINRLSIGVQSFFDEDLQWMNRAHNASQALHNIKLAQGNGFNNISIDLIYGTPTLSNEQWQQNINKALALNIPHLSCYALTVEPKTALHKMIQQHTMQPVDAAKQTLHFNMLMQALQQAGYEHYEISNFALHGFKSRHNSSYWQSENYLGLGPSAHSFNGTSRQWNIANNTLYMQSIQQNIVPFETETLTPKQQLNEYIMTSLRTSEGISVNKLRQWNNSNADNILHDAQKWMNTSHLIYLNQHLILTAKGKHFADGIAADLFRV